MTTDDTPDAARPESPRDLTPAQRREFAESTSTSARGCCGGPPRADTAACCALDEAARSSGEGGCGCGAAAGCRRPTSSDPLGC